MLSYFYHFGGKDGTGQKELKMSDAVFVLPINLLVVMCTQPIGAYLLLRLNPKLMTSVCTGLMFLCAMGSSYIKSFWVFLMFYPIIFGFMMGSGYLPPLRCGWEWLPERKGFSNGMILGAFGFGAFAFSFLSLAVINPDNIKVEIYEDGRKWYPPSVA